MNRENSRISVIIPAFNREELLPATLHSLLNQSYPAHEIIVVDDGSTDGTAMAAEIFGSPVRVIRQSNAGPSAARNHGFRDSTGEFIHFFDSDDIALPNKHEVQLRELVATGADIAYGPWVKGRFTPQGFAAENSVLQQLGLPHGDLIKALLTNWSIVPHACLFRRSIVEKSGGFPEHLLVAEDQLMFLRCILAGAKVVHSPGTLELYRVGNKDKLSATDFNRSPHLTHWARFLIEAERECAKYGIHAIAWFGYRRRLWEASQDLVKHEVPDPEIKTELRNLLRGRGPDGVYRFERDLQRIRQGLRARLGLGRAHPSFRCGPIDAVQAKMLDRFPVEALKCRQHEMERNFTKLPLRDEIPGPVHCYIAKRLAQIRRKLNTQGGMDRREKFWGKQEICEAKVAHQKICQAICEASPYAVGRLGGVEASIMMWALGIRPETGKLAPPLAFVETQKGATNAGIRPRNKPSYRTFAKLCKESLETLDWQGIWKTSYEASCLAILPPRRLVNVETLAPSDGQGDHWMNALEGKRVLVVSPFNATVQSQIPKLGRVWGKRGWVRDVEFKVVPFPYLIDDNYKEPWWQVYERVATVIARADYDVGLFGCGGLGVLFAADAKRAGRVGIHLGGHLQLLFGIYGNRHLEQEWFRRMINRDWVRPIWSEVPQTAQRVENGCYW